MLNVAILDGVERLSDQLSNATKFQCGILQIGDSAVAGSLEQSLSQWRVYPPICPSTDYSKIWISSYAGGRPANKCALFDVAAETIVFDDNGARGLTQIMNDSSGAVWAQGTVAGFYGLWKRTGAGAWTQMLSDSDISNGIRWRPSDGSLWYQSYTNNHYLLANGAATLSAAPTGTVIPVAVNSAWNVLDAPYLTSTSFGSARFANANGTTNTASTLPYDVWLNYGRAMSGYNPPMVQIHIDATYSLLMSASGYTTLSSTYFLYMFNKSSGVIRFIGTLPVLALHGGTVPTTTDLSPIAAKWIATGLRIYMVGNVATNGSDATTGNKGGMIRVDYTYQPNF